MAWPDMRHPSADPDLTLYSRDMIFRVSSSPVFRSAIASLIDNPESLQKDAALLTNDEWDILEDAVRDIFLEVAPTVCNATVPPDLEEAYNDDPLPSIVGADGVFAIFDPAGFGLGETWFTSAEDAILDARSNWIDLDFCDSVDK
jgi:hypothetical protein